MVGRLGDLWEWTVLNHQQKGPPSELALPRLERVSDTEGEHSDDSAGEKEAKRQRSEPSTPVSTPRRLPYEYDALMGITKVVTKEAEGFDEDLDSTEYHDANDATEDLTRKDEAECIVPQQRSMGFQGGYGSSSLKECIELLNVTVESAPAPLDSGVGQKSPIRHTQCGFKGFNELSAVLHLALAFLTRPSAQIFLLWSGTPLP